MPDIAADGDTDSGLLTGYIASGTSSHPGPYQTQVNAGTSLATPVIAGLVADAQQGQKSDFGFINPLLYRLAGTRAFHDILPVTAAVPQQDRDACQAGSGLESTGPRRLRLPGARLHHAGVGQGLRHDDRHRHAQRCRFHRRAARRRSLLG